MYANIAGGELQGWAALLDKWAMKDAYDAEMRRQAAYRQQAGQVFNQRGGTADLGTAQQQMAQGAALRNQRYNQILQAPLAVSTHGQPSGNPAREAATAKLQGANRARLGAYSDWALQQAIQNIQTQHALNQIENFAGGTASVFPYRMYDAQHSWDTLSEIGQAISSLGGGSTDYSKYNQGTPSPNMATGGAYGNYTPVPAQSYEPPPPSYDYNYNWVEEG